LKFFTEKEKNDEDFEEVPINNNFDPDDYDSDERAEMLAMGSMLKNPSQRSLLVESSINRYMFDDAQETPRWFAEDEEKHNKPEMPITKEQVVAYKKELRAIDARTSKKVTEAKARKKKIVFIKIRKSTC